MNHWPAKQDFLRSGAIFSQGQNVWLFWGKPRQSDQRPFGPALYCNDFFLSVKNPWIEFPFFEVVEKRELLNRFQSAPLSWSWQPASRPLFDWQMDLAQSWFKEGLKKIVPYVFERRTEIPSTMELEALISNGLKQDRGFLYGFWQDDGGILGLTPEILIEQLDSRTIQSMALAGTVTREQFEREPHALLEDPKQNDEHQLVVENLREELEPLGVLSVSPRDVLLTPSLAHLHSAVRLSTSAPVALESLIEKLHPTPALGTSPKRGWHEWLKIFNEREPRERFGAPIGLSLERDRALVLVAIRNLQWSGHQTKLGAGCGVVPASQLEQEWLELTHKRQSVKKVFGLL